MKKATVLLLSLCFISLAQAQPPMGGGRIGNGRIGNAPMGMGMPNEPIKSFYTTESDSVANASLKNISEQLGLNAKQTKKMLKLISQEYEEKCRNIQVALMDLQFSNSSIGFNRYGGMGMPNANISTEPESLDTANVKKTYDEISAKYIKRYSKVLEEEQAEKWLDIKEQNDSSVFFNLLQHVQDNTEDLF